MNLKILGPKAVSTLFEKFIHFNNVFISNLYIKSVTCVETTPVADTILEFHEIAHFSQKLPLL